MKSKNESECLQPCGKVLVLDNQINGNGNDGLAEKMDTLWDSFQQLLGALKFIKWLLGFISIGTIANFFITLFLK